MLNIDKLSKMDDWTAREALRDLSDRMIQTLYKAATARMVQEFPEGSKRDAEWDIPWAVEQLKLELRRRRLFGGNDGNC